MALTSDTFNKQLALLLNREISAAGVTKKAVARSVGISEQYLTQITSPGNVYRKSLLTEERLLAIVLMLRKHDQRSKIDSKVERLLRRFGDPRYRMIYHLLKLDSTVRDVEAVVESLDRFCNEYTSRSQQ